MSKFLISPGAGYSGIPLFRFGFSSGKCIFYYTKQLAEVADVSEHLPFIFIIGCHYFIEMV
jgi:hypothetical protein